MSDGKPSGSEAGTSTRTMEIVVAMALFATGALVLIDGYRLGAGWADDGPQSGHFLFYAGLLLCISSIAAMAQGDRRMEAPGPLPRRGRTSVRATKPTVPGFMPMKFPSFI